MTEITRAHAEWAVVDRLRAMLKETPHAEYNVTQSYGLCVAILAWVMQRVQTPEIQTNSPEDRAAISVKSDLDGQRVEEPPWELTNKNFRGLTAFDFLKWLRNVSCHGDARKVFPENTHGELTGFRFRMKSDGLVLKEADLRRIGCALADMYCKALKSSTSFVDDARSMREVAPEI